MDSGEWTGGRQRIFHKLANYEERHGKRNEWMRRLHEAGITVRYIRSRALTREPLQQEQATK
jgi:hypothetical protein